MPDINTLGILAINCNIIDKKEVDGTENCNMNTDYSQEPTSEQHHINMWQQTATREVLFKHSILKFENKDKPVVTDNDNIEYFIPGLNSNIDRRASAEITQQL